MTYTSYQEYYKTLLLVKIPYYVISYLHKLKIYKSNKS